MVGVARVAALSVSLNSLYNHSPHALCRQLSLASRQIYELTSYTVLGPDGLHVYGLRFLLGVISESLFCLGITTYRLGKIDSRDPTNTPWH